jgi:hypothetical protein
MQRAKEVNSDVLIRPSIAGNQYSELEQSTQILINASLIGNQYSELEQST